LETGKRLTGFLSVLNCYFVLRLLGFEDVMLYDNSWFDWALKDQTHYLLMN
jgi:3-mercaptopyruvate sulfurtransferase SseA